MPIESEGRRTKIALLHLVCLLLASTAFADMPEMQAAQEPTLDHGLGGATDMCSIKYYDYCSGWIWIYSVGFDDEVGVVFDLPAECGKDPGAVCENTHFWWYWRYTQYNRSPVTYRFYEVDQDNCLVGDPLGEFTNVAPILERWNYHDGFGAFNADRVAIVASAPFSIWPRAASDNNFRNQAASCAEIPAATNSYVFRQDGVLLCPPTPFEDVLGPVNLLMDAGFDCQTTATEASSWGAVKNLFR